MISELQSQTAGVLVVQEKRRAHSKILSYIKPISVCFVLLRRHFNWIWVISDEQVSLPEDMNLHRTKTKIHCIVCTVYQRGRWRSMRMLGVSKKVTKILSIEGGGRLLVNMGEFVSVCQREYRDTMYCTVYYTLHNFWKIFQSFWIFNSLLPTVFYNIFFFQWTQKYQSRIRIPELIGLPDLDP